MSSQRTVVGIDLGTTFSAIAIVNKHGKPEIICDSSGNRTTPSVVFFDFDGPPLVGHNAKAMAASEPERVVQFVKRQMGDENYLFVIDENDQGLSAPEISALILKRLKKNAEEVLGRPITDAVITVPAYFRDDQRSATLEAGKIAGLNVLELINEPTAAALAYGIENVHDRRRILVYDLGGGTFDITILDIDHGQLRVLATDGDALLGGKDFDDRILQHMFRTFREACQVDLSGRAEVEAEWRERAEKMKIRLSELRSVRERVSFEGLTATVELTQDQFNLLTEDLLARTEDLVTVTLEKAGLNWSNISETLLVGGSTRMPAVGAMVERLSGKKPLRTINPDDAVALGAAIKGALLTRDWESNPGYGELPAIPTPIDVTAHSLGIVTVKPDGQVQNSIILSKNTAIPASAERVYSTFIDNQTSVAIRVTQGEDTDLDYCRIVGEFVLGPIPPRPKGRSKIRITLSYDKNSNVKVSAFDEGSSTSIVQEISARDIKTSKRVLDARKAKIDSLFEER